MKFIEDGFIEISKLKYNFGNPRKTKRLKEEIEELKKSIERYGSWRSIGIDEENNVIFGNKLSMALKELDIKQTPAKKLIGYTQAELKAINIKDNEHVGEFDIELLNEWQKEIMIEIPDFVSIDDEEFNEIKTENLNYYKAIYFFIECKSIEEFNLIQNELESIKNKGISIEQSSN
jgi:hypothetical protein